MKIRASSLPLYQACKASAHVREGEILIKEEVGIEAKVGTVVHFICRQIVEQELDSIPKIGALGDLESSRKDIRTLSTIFLHGWQALKNQVLDPRCEESLSRRSGDLQVSGHPDILGREVGSNALVVIDVKTGRKTEEASYLAQVQGYGWLGLEEQQEVVTILLWLRDQEQSTRRFSREKLFAWVEDLAKPWDGQTYKAGEYCQYCPRLASCPGRLERLKGSLQLFEPETNFCLDEEGNLLPAEKLIAAFEQSKELAKAIKAFQEHFREEVGYRGEICSPSQRAYLKQRTGRAAIDPIKAWPILREHLSDEAIAQATTLSKTRLTEAIAEQSERGTKKMEIKTFLEQLREVGALTEGIPSKVLQIEKIKEVG